MKEHMMIWVVSIIIFGMLCVGWISGYMKGGNDWRTEATELGHGEYYLDKDHSRQWRWKERNDGRSRTEAR